jgi:hypothetical protein
MSFTSVLFGGLTRRRSDVIRYRDLTPVGRVLVALFILGIL